MTSKKDFLGLVDTSGQVGRPPLVGMQLFHQRAVRAGDSVGARAHVQAKDLIGLLFGHFAAARRSPPRCRILLRVLTPAGIPAVKIRHQ